MSLFNTPQQQYQTNLDGLFTHSKAEALLQRMHKSVERHDIEISSLRCDIDGFQTQLQSNLHSLNESMSMIKSQMDTLLQRLERIELSIKIPGSPPSSNVTVGEVIIANRRTIAKALNLVSQKITAHDLKQSIQEEIEPMKESIETWKKDLVSNDAMQKSNETISALIDRVDIIANDMCHKVDRTLFKSISSDATCIKNYADFIRTTESTTKTMEEELKDSIRPMIQTHSEKIKALEDHRVQIGNKVEHSCCTRDQYNKLNSYVETIVKDLDCKANATTVNEIEDNQRQTVIQVTSALDDIKTLFSAHETLAKYMTKRLDTLKTQVGENKSNNGNKQFENYVHTNDFEEQLTKLQSVIEAKACKDVLVSLQQAIKQMENELSLTKRKADLSAQFVSWYGKQNQSDVEYDEEYDIGEEVSGEI